MVKKILALGILFLITSSIFAQKNLSVDLNDPVYDILDYIQIRDYVKPLHNSRPYSLDLVLDTLKNSLEYSSEMSKSEVSIIQDTIHRLEPTVSTEFTDNSTFTQSVSTLANTGYYRYETNENGIPITAQVGIELQADLFTNLNELGISSDNWINAYVLGDLGNNFSYNITAGVGLMKLDFDAYKPFSYTQTWAGYQAYLNDLDNFAGLTEDPSAGTQIMPEFAASFFDNKFGINFSRIRRDWGTGNGNLMLSGNAQPFSAFEMYLHPVDFISLSTMTGTLEYFRDDSTGIKPDTFQNNFTAFMGEIYIGEYVYGALTSSSIWPKRFDMGYLLPGMIPFLYQNMVGDYDNLQLGGSIGIKIPKYANFYLNVFTDELNFTSDDFFHKDRNMYSYQTGLNVAIPNSSLVTFNFQYTKIEPYMYTHPGATHPAYNERMELNYVNHGESLGYYLPPNSDELKIVVDSIPYWFLNTSLSYSLVRHGVSHGSDPVDGSSIYDSLNYSDVNAGTKYFLVDGVYEWIHSLGLDAEIDMHFINELPITLRLAYTLSYKHHTIEDEPNKSFKPLNAGDYINTWGNYFTLSVKIW